MRMVVCLSVCWPSGEAEIVQGDRMGSSRITGYKHWLFINSVFFFVFVLLFSVVERKVGMTRQSRIEWVNAELSSFQTLYVAMATLRRLLCWFVLPYLDITVVEGYIPFTKAFWQLGIFLLHPHWIEIWPFFPSFRFTLFLLNSNSWTSCLDKNNRYLELLCLYIPFFFSILITIKYACAET